MRCRQEGARWGLRVCRLGSLAAHYAALSACVQENRVRVRSHRWERRLWMGGRAASGRRGRAASGRREAAVGALGLPGLRATCGGENLPALPLPAPLPRPCSGCSRTQVSFLPLKCKANSQVCWCVCCVQRLPPPTPCLWPRPPLLFGPPRDVGPEPGVQEGSRTSQPCSLARAGQGRDHSGEAAGPGGEQVSGLLAGISPGQGPLGCPSPAQKSEGPVWVGSGQGLDRPEGWVHWTQASELCWGPCSRAQQSLFPAKSQFCS